MKLRAGDQTQELQDSILRYAIRGAAIGGIISLGVAVTLRYKAPQFFQSKSGYLRSLVYATPAAFCTITSMEFGSREFEERKRLEDASSIVSQSLTKKDDSSEHGFGHFLDTYKYPIIVSSWAAAMGGSFWMVNRDKYMTKAQKIVQARVYAQGLTVLLLLASVFFSVSGTSENRNTITDKKKADSARSWERNVKYVSAENSK